MAKFKRRLKHQEGVERIGKKVYLEKQASRAEQERKQLEREWFDWAKRRNTIEVGDPLNEESRKW